MKVFKHNKTGNLYELVQEHLLFKDLKDTKRIYTADSFEEEYENIYEWRKSNNLILYKALYDNPDGPYFVRYAEDFYKNFTELDNYSTYSKDYWDNLREKVEEAYKLKKLDQDTLIDADDWK